jgi:hypothetical protein
MYNRRIMSAEELIKHQEIIEHVGAAVRELSPEIAVAAIAELVNTEAPIDHIWVRQQANDWIENRLLTSV